MNPLCAGGHIMETREIRNVAAVWFHPVTEIESSTIRDIPGDGDWVCEVITTDGERVWTHRVGPIDITGVQKGPPDEAPTDSPFQTPNSIAAVIHGGTLRWDGDDISIEAPLVEVYTTTTTS